MQKYAKEIIFIILGNILYAAGVVFFILPSGLLTGGTTGIALAVNHYTGIPVSSFVFLFNSIMFLTGFFILGKKFAVTTLLSTFAYPIALSVIQKLSQGYTVTDDIFLCTIFGGLCIGISVAIVIRQGASTGGMDIPPLVLQKLFRIPVSESLIVFDLIILILQMFFCKKEHILYGILMVICYTVVIDKMLVHGKEKMQILIVSKYASDIKEKIIQDVDRGCTMLDGETGYLKRKTEILLSVVSARELYKVEKIAHSLDENAFIIISRVSEVRGRGFDRYKRYIETKNS